MIYPAVLPQEGFVNAEALIGRQEVTQEDADRNKQLAEEARRNGRSFNKPRRPRHGILGIFPGGRTSFFEAIKKGEFPPPIKRGRNSFWKVEDVRRALDAIGSRKTAA